jgi:hypothetical protein
METFGGVDVADAHHQTTVHQQWLDRHPAAVGRRMQPVPVEALGQRLDAQIGQRRVTFDADAFVPEQRPEATRVAKTQNGVVEQQVNMIVLLCRRIRRHQPQTAGHAEMEEQPAAAAGALTVQQKIFAAAQDRVHAQARKPRIEAGRNLVAQPRRTHDGADNTLL